MARLLFAVLLFLLTVAAFGAPGRLESSFTFQYKGQPAWRWLNQWRSKVTTKKLDATRLQVTTTWEDGETGLQVRCVEVRYHDFPAIEWTVYLKNAGTADTPIIENLQGLFDSVERNSSGEFILHHNVGSPADGNDYAPIETPLPTGVTKRISAAGGRPTNSDMSYFNLAWGDGGRIIVVGWPGQWAATFTHEDEKSVKVVAGQELTHFKLHPGEEVRTPLTVLLDYKGDWTDGQNQWRHWMMAYGMPKPGGQLPKPLMLASSSRAYREMIGANEANQIMNIGQWFEEGFHLDYWWMDAGWYVQDSGWPQVGTWEVDRKRFPNGFKPISDFAHSKGSKILVWFEPERVAPHTWLADTHPEWLLNAFGNLEGLRSKALGSPEPNIGYNAGDSPVDWHGIHWNPHSISLHPGPKGEYSVIRFTAPSAGTYAIDAGFAGIDEKTTTDVHVLAGGKPLFDSFILLNGHGRSEHFAGSAELAVGQTIDFVVGWGNHDYGYDSTGLIAMVAGPDGVAHAAATEFGGPLWSYGWLKPADAPDAATFTAYDLKGRSGAMGDQLLNLGNPDARKWLTDHIDKLLTDNGIDLYRQDFNIDPLDIWRANDAPDRQGITENHHVVGYLAYWDELRRRHPNMLIDSCASGGRRNDLETMRRSVPLWRSDYAYEPIGHQCMTYGISMWLPYHGTGTVADEGAPYYGGGVTPVHPYAFWSNAVPALGCGIDIREKGIDYTTLRRLFEEWRSIGPYYYGDFYPITDYTRRDDTWIAWQYNRPDHGDGVVEAFRRPKASITTEALRLRGLDPALRYRVVVIDGPALENSEFTGRELMGNGITVTFTEAPQASILRYQRIR